MGKLYVCTTRCHHGKIWEPGEEATEETLHGFCRKERPDPKTGKMVKARPYIPPHFKPAGTEFDNPDRVEEYRNYLAAKGIQFHPNLGESKLKELVDRARVETE